MHKWDLESCARRDSSWTSATRILKSKMCGQVAACCHLRNMFQLKLDQTETHCLWISNCSLKSKMCQHFVQELLASQGKRDDFYSLQIVEV